MPIVCVRRRSEKRRRLTDLPVAGAAIGGVDLLTCGNSLAGDFDRELGDTVRFSVATCNEGYDYQSCRWPYKSLNPTPCE